MIHDLVRSVGEHPSFSAADQIIQLFKSYEGVSYVYVKHRYDTGFVKFTKRKGYTREIVPEVLIGDTGPSRLDEVQLWRKELTLLGEANDILVAFAWSHKEEARKLSMFPEFVVVDLTFGVNRQRRSLLVATGIDGHNKSFTGFRCFMPSKTKQAYFWALHNALPLLIGQTSLNLMQCISTDNEEALIQAIDESRHSPGGIPSNVKHRLDFYHLFIQVWNQKCSPPNNLSREGMSALEIIRQWVYSWVTDIESEAECQHSLNSFQRYITSIKPILGNHLSTEVEKAVSRVISNIDKVGSHYFQ
jgi:MULE transposase domain.